MEKSVGDALRLLLANEAFLLEADAAERAIAARLAAYLAPHFPKHQVDVEYNRHGLDPKVVNLPPNCRGGGARRIFPDVIPRTEWDLGASASLPGGTLGLQYHRRR